jgi:hypothetical protein
LDDICSKYYHGLGLSFVTLAYLFAYVYSTSWWHQLHYKEQTQILREITKYLSEPDSTKDHIGIALSSLVHLDYTRKQLKILVEPGGFMWNCIANTIGPPINTKVVCFNNLN